MCGIAGIVGKSPVNSRLYDALTVLQHRGQDAAGIVTAVDGLVCMRKGQGLVRDVFSQQDMLELRGNIGIGHVRYPTAGGDNVSEAQPFYVNAPYGIVLGHNGNLTNATELADVLIREERRHLNTSSDSEVLLNVLASELQRVGTPRVTAADVFAAVSALFRRCRGAYAVVAMVIGHGILGFRDPNGIRPLVIGQRETAKGTEFMLASESVALDMLGFTQVRDVAPGEAVFIDEAGRLSSQQCVATTRQAPCIFEYVYFARPDSTIGGRNVYKTRVEFGRQLAREHPVAADLVIPVPDSGVYAALGYSEESKIPYEMAFIRNHYVGRSFLQPSQLIRDFNVRVKLNLIGDLVKGKRVVIVDDSIVRGTTCKTRVNTLKEAGAKEVHVRVSCPPHMHPCVYGIDFPDRNKLMAANNSVDEIRKYLNADSLHYLSAEGMVKATGLPKTDFCTACWDGNYPVAYDPATDKEIIERRKCRTGGLVDALAKEKKQIKLF